MSVMFEVSQVVTSSVPVLIAVRKSVIDIAPLSMTPLTVHPAYTEPLAASSKRKNISILLIILLKKIATVLQLEKDLHWV